MAGSGKETRISEYQTCFTYEPNQDKDECCGASGRKFRRACVFCPNYERWRQQRKREEEKENGDKSENVH